MRRARGEVDPGTDASVGPVDIKSRALAGVKKIGAIMNKPRKAFAANAAKFKARKSGGY